MNVSKLLDTISKIIESDSTVSLSKHTDILISYFKNSTVPMYPTFVKALPKEFGASATFKKQL